MQDTCKKSSLMPKSNHPQILLILPSKYWSNLYRCIYLHSHQTQAAMIFHLASSDGGGVQAQLPTFADFSPSLSHLSKCKCDFSPTGNISEASHCPWIKSQILSKTNQACIIGALPSSATSFPTCVFLFLASGPLVFPSSSKPQTPSFLKGFRCCSLCDIFSFMRLIPSYPQVYNELSFISQS